MIALPSSHHSLRVVVLAAGLGTRMRSDLPKVLHRIAHRPMLAHVVATAQALEPEQITLVVGPGQEEAIAAAVPGHRLVVQHQRRGTGDALRAAAASFHDFAGTVLVLYGDTPLVSEASLRALVARAAAPTSSVPSPSAPARPGVVVAGFEADDPTGYGRLILGADGVERIVEQRDATPEEARITLCNGGLMALDAEGLADRLARLRPANAQGEFYMTDLPALARADGRAVAHVVLPADDLLGVNSRVELAAVEARFQARLRRQAMLGGATLIDPDSVYLAADTRLGRDVVIEPNVVFGPGVAVGDGVQLRAFSHLEGAVVEAGAVIGPYARLRPGTEVGAGAHIGNFVELKATRFAGGAKANHLAYLGDADVGAGANVGAGTITCNYDGIAKHRTVIGAGVFVGSNATLVAPLTLGEGAYVAAGSTVTESVPADGLVFGRARQTVKSGRAAALRGRLKANKI